VVIHDAPEEIRGAVDSDDEHAQPKNATQRANVVVKHSIDVMCCRHTSEEALEEEGEESVITSHHRRATPHQRTKRPWVSAARFPSSNDTLAFLAPGFVTGFSHMSFDM
jgi:hypothetical protein